jgi:hypothetical protein
VSASSLHKCSRCASRSYQGTEIFVPAYNFVEGFNFVFNVIKGPRDIFDLGVNFSEAAQTELNIFLSRSTHRVAKSTHLFRRSLIDSCSLVFFSASASTLVLRSFISWSKRHELSFKIVRASLSSLLNLVFWDHNSASEPLAVCSRMSFSFRKVSSSLILSSKPLIMTSFSCPWYPAAFSMVCLPACSAKTNQS